MALERKDAKVYFDADIHADIKDLADVDGLTIADFIEAIVVPVVRKRRHDVMKLAGRFRRRGISQNDPELGE